MPRLLLVGTDHQLVPPSRLAELTARQEQVQAALLAQRTRGQLRGGVVLATCNRFEVLLEVDGEADEGLQRRLLGCSADFPLRELADAAAVQHLVEVTVGAHSMAFGEEQIQGQVRAAFKRAEDLGLMSRRLHMLQTRVLSAARAIRQGTGLQHRPRSVAAMAAEQVLAAGGSIAVVGAGETARLVVEILRRRGAVPALVVNRTLCRAEALVRLAGAGRALALADFLRGEGPPVQCAVFAVRSAGVLLDRSRAGGLRLAVDVSQPSVLAPDLRDEPGLRVLDLDDLARTALQERSQHEGLHDAVLAAAAARARELWAEVGGARPNLGRVIDLHVEGALAVLEQAFQGRLGHLAEADRGEVREVLLRAAKRNAHYHIQDIRQLATAP